MRTAGLGEYVDLLIDEEVDKATFLTLSDRDLIDIGIDDPSHRFTILKIATNLRHTYK